MRIATFNVNSLRARVDRVIAFLLRQEIDVLAIQETKVTDAKFPLEPFTAAGYQVARHGISQWNGVALASRVGLSDVQIGLPHAPGYGDPPVQEARAIGARCGGIEVWSLYIPNGREIDHPHYHYKLDWFGALRALGESRLAADANASILLCGDFNVAPQDEDVWDMAAFEGLTHVTPRERDAFRSVVDAGFADVVRPRLPGMEGHTYWDYQQLRFPKKEGMRIDFLLGSPAVQALVTDAFVDRDERKGKGASDHTPVVITLDTNAPVIPAADPALVEPADAVTDRGGADGAGGDGGSGDDSAGAASLW